MEAGLGRPSAENPREDPRARLFAASPFSACVRAVVTHIARRSAVKRVKSTCVEKLNEMALDDTEGNK